MHNFLSFVNAFIVAMAKMNSRYVLCIVYLVSIVQTFIFRRLFFFSLKLALFFRGFSCRLPSHTLRRMCYHVFFAMFRCEVGVQFKIFFFLTAHLGDSACRLPSHTLRYMTIMFSLQCLDVKYMCSLRFFFFLTVPI